MKLEVAINQNFNKLNENDKLVMKQIVSSQIAFRNLSCEQMAGACHISRATLLRVCRKIGLQSFSELKYVLKENQIEDIQGKDDFTTITMNYQLLLDELKKISYQPICEKIDAASTIYIYGTGNEQKSLAQEFKKIFLTVGICVIDLFDAGEIELMKPSFEPNDIFIIVSLSGETKEGIAIIRSICDCIQTISITRLNSNTISSLCQQNLYVATRKLESEHATAYEVVGAFYALLDMLFMNYVEYRNRKQGMLEHR